MGNNHDQAAANREAIAEVLTADKKRQFDETRSVLDVLRATRQARGGVGAPLIVPNHLRSAANGQGIVVTDADLREDTPLPVGLTRDERSVKVEE